MKAAASVRTIAFLGDYLPRKCGIATFTSDLLRAVAARDGQRRCFAVPVNDLEGCYQYPETVRFEIEERDLDSYHRAADFLNSSDVDAVCVQHEFGIYGGPAGSHLLALLRGLTMPVVTTLHTVLRQPNADQLRVMLELISLSGRVVVMTERGREILQEVYQVPEAKIDLIPHGIPDVPFAAPAHYKPGVGLQGKQVLLTFGLLSPNKGIEHVLRALPAILAEFPDLVYVLLGATHPNELRSRGDAYRAGLQALSVELGVADHVIFENRFVELRELTEYLGAADIYITPYLDEAQITSGTLSYAFGAGKPVVSTPYWHAAELLRGERGVLVPFADPAAIAREVAALLRDPERRNAMSRAAYQTGRGMVWSETAALYVRSFERAQSKAAVARQTGAPVELNLDHLYRMTDDTGLLQHAHFTAPNLAEGYCTDDNARAVILAVLLGRLPDALPAAGELAALYASFLQRAFDPKIGRFHNFLSSDRQWLDERGSEDSHGRALWALGTAEGGSPSWNSRPVAARLFAPALPAVAGFTSPRAWAFSLLGIDEHLRAAPQDPPAVAMREELTRRLVFLFDAVSGPGWTWFEDRLTYDNAKLPHALIASGRATGKADVAERGLRALRWLVEVQTSGRGQLRPIGSNGFYLRRGERALFDQQPIEAQATISACLEAYRATADPWWREQAQRAFAWFLGSNDLRLELYSTRSGGCRDGLHMDRSNENQGAESMLAFLLSLTELRLEGSQPQGVPGTDPAVPFTT